MHLLKHCEQKFSIEGENVHRAISNRSTNIEISFSCQAADHVLGELTDG
jgi:hypothetical protein